MNIAHVIITEGAVEPGFHRRRGVDSPNDVAAVAFESLMNATCTMAQATTLSQSRTSPGQMFEPAVVDPQAQRVTELKNEAGSTRAAPVEHRSAAAPRGQRAPSFTPGDAKRAVVQPFAEPKPSPPEQAAQPPAPPPEPLDMPVGYAATRVGESAAKPVAQPRSVSAALPPNTPAPMTSGTTSRSTTVARQVGQFLSASRAEQSGEPKVSANTVPAATAPPQGRPATARTTPTESKPTPAPTRPGVETAEQTGDTPFARLIRSIRLQVGERTSSARLQLHPPELGRMRVDVRLDGDRIALEVRTETEGARELVAQRAGELKTALAEHGIYVERLDVAAYDVRLVNGEAETRRAPAGSSESARRRRSEHRTSDRGRLSDTTILDVQG
jgi:flagellar hook-length control protein FliK